MCIYTLTQDANRLAEDYIRENMTEVDPKECGIDDRACYRMWKGTDGVAIKKSDKRRFNYYGGGEYVSEDSVHELGDYVFYDREDSRVQGWLGEDEDDAMDDFNYVGSRHHY